MLYTLTLTELCSEMDQGGGVACGGDYIVFTRAQIPDWYLTELGSPELQDELTKAALAVETVINFYMSRSDLGGQGLRSLPALQTNTSHEIDQKPWFFLNAAKVDPRGIGIAGRGSMIGGTLVETLLAVLSRPWCILELCYSTTAAVDALLKFANLACQLDVGAYTAARILLSHERRHRLLSHLRVRGTVDPAWLTDSEPMNCKVASMEEIRSLCSALFIVGENSYSGFWMRAICVCALKLNFSLSIFGSSFSDSTKAYSESMRSENLIHWAIERQSSLPWNLNNRQGPITEEKATEEALKKCFSSLSILFSQQSLPNLYHKFLREINDLAT